MSVKIKTYNKDVQKRSTFIDIILDNNVMNYVVLPVRDHDAEISFSQFDVNILRMFTSFCSRLLWILIIYLHVNCAIRLDNNLCFENKRKTPHLWFSFYSTFLIPSGWRSLAFASKRILTARNRWFESHWSRGSYYLFIMHSCVWNRDQHNIIPNEMFTLPHFLLWTLGKKSFMEVSLLFVEPVYTTFVIGLSRQKRG